MVSRNGSPLVPLRQLKLALCIGCVCLLVMCEKFSKSASQPVARVGNAVLTIDDLNHSIPHEYTSQITQQQRINYVKQWMDTELLYQEALRRKMHNEKEIGHRLQQMKKDLLSAEMISRTVPDMQRDAISETALLNYYEQNKNSFLRESDVVKYADLVVPDLKTGWEIRNTITIDNFLQLATSHSTIPVPDPYKIPYIPVQNLPPELAGVLLSLKTNGISLPVKLPDGVHIMLLIDRQKAGDVCLLEEVKEEIYNILINQFQKKEIDNLLAELKKKTETEFHFEMIMQDSTSHDEPEIDSAISMDTVKTP